MNLPQKDLSGDCEQIGFNKTIRSGRPPMNNGSAFLIPIPLERLKGRCSVSQVKLVVKSKMRLVESGSHPYFSPKRVSPREGHEKPCCSAGVQRMPDWEPTFGVDRSTSIGSFNKSLGRLPSGDRALLVSPSEERPSFLILQIISQFSFLNSVNLSCRDRTSDANVVSCAPHDLLT